MSLFALKFCPVSRDCNLCSCSCIRKIGYYSPLRHCFILPNFAAKILIINNLGNEKDNYLSGNPCRMPHVGRMSTKNETTQNEAGQTESTDVTSRIADCKVTLGDVTFTHAINGADTCVSLLADRTLEFRCAEGLDFFCDPNDGKLSNNTLPVLLIPTDNTKPFTLTAKVTPEFTAEDFTMQPTCLCMSMIRFGRNWPSSRTNMAITASYRYGHKAHRTTTTMTR